MKKELIDKIKKGCLYSIQGWIMKCFLIAIALDIVLEMLGRRSILEGFEFIFNSPYVYVYNVIIIFFTLLFALLFRKRVFTISLIIILWLTCGIVNYIMLGYRVTPFTALEVTMFRDMLGMMTVYFKPYQIVLIVAGIIAGIALLTYLFIKTPKFEGKRRVIKTMVACIVTFVLLNLFTSYGVKHNLISDNFSNLGIAYEDYGFAYCFSNSLIDIGINEPDNYSEETMLDIKELLDSYRVLGSKKTPNIILIQLESFIDTKNVIGLDMSSDPIPNFTKLKNEGPSGFLTVPSIGAGTANTEFEVGTGMKTQYFGAGEYPYKTVLTHVPSESMAQTLKKQGYSTHAIHNHKGAFYDRNKVFANIGFDSFTSLEYMYDVEQTSRGWAKDYLLTDEIMNSLKSTEEKDYVFTISVQGHGKYPLDYEDEYTKHITLTYEEEKLEPAFSYYVNQTYEMDEMIGHLVDELDAFGEDYVLVLYGDHLPSLELTEEKLSSGNLFQTEYVIHSNLDLNLKDKDINSYDLSTYLFDALNLDYGYVQRAYTVYGRTEEFDNILQLIQYDMLYGEQYMFQDNPYEATDMKMGTKDITLDEVIVEGEDIIVKGDNFNEYSKVILNDYRVDTEYIDRNTLIVYDEELEKEDVVCVGQINSNKVIMSTSNSLTYNVK